MRSLAPLLFLTLAACAVRSPAPASSTALSRAEPAAAAPASVPEPVPAPEAAPAADTSAADALFRDNVRPVLARRCAPCHEPGGRMYARLPFDDAAVVRDNSEGVLRRIKDPAEDRAALEAWLQAN